MTSFLFSSLILQYEFLLASVFHLEDAVELGYLFKFSISSVATRAHLDLFLVIEAFIEEVPGDLKIAYSVLSRNLLPVQAVLFLIVFPSERRINSIIFEAGLKKIFRLNVGAKLGIYRALLEPV